MHCLSVARVSWDKQSWQSNTHDDVAADLEEKDAIEREIARRNVTAYHPPFWVTDQYVHDHCHCRHWVVNLWK